MRPFPTRFGTSIKHRVLCAVVADWTKRKACMGYISTKLLLDLYLQLVWTSSHTLFSYIWLTYHTYVSYHWLAFLMSFHVRKRPSPFLPGRYLLFSLRIGFWTSAAADLSELAHSRSRALRRRGTTCAENFKYRSCRDSNPGPAVSGLLVANSITGRAVLRTAE